MADEEKQMKENNGNGNGEKIAPAEAKNILKGETVRRAKIEDEMKKAYIDYAMSVIVARALPAVEDGLKPVQRRILYAMNQIGLQHNKPTKKSARIIGECFTKDTLILTDKGLIPIQNIKQGNNVYTQDAKHKVVRLYEMPKKKLLKIVLKNGIQNIVTSSQLFKVLDKNFKYKWKKAKDLTENDWLVVRTYYPKINNPVSLPNFEGKRMVLNKNIAYLLGQLISDGWISKDYSKKKLPRIGFCSSSVLVIKRIQNILKKEFGYRAKIEKKKLSTEKRKKVLSIRINSLRINQFIVSTFSLENILAPTKKIPFQIFTSPKSVIFSFISGLIDGDGHIHKSRNVINYVSVSEKLINELLLITQQLGIIGKKFLLKSQKSHSVNGRIIKSKHSVYYIEFKGEFSKKLAHNLNLAEEKKKEGIKRISSNRAGKSDFEVIPFAGNLVFSELSNKHFGGGWYKDRENKKFRLGIKYPAGCKIRYSKDLKEKELRKSQIIEWNILKKLEKINSRYFGFLKEIFDNQIYFIKIKKIEESDPEKTYDFQVNGAHEFIANGVVSHNCMGKYHPHGDMAIYDALVRMAQPFSLRYPLIRGQGNFGSIDGDPPAASRYTEAKLQPIAEELLQDIEKKTVKMIPNFDNSLQEPELLPGKLPNLLINGASGIAVGMATAIPPHNVAEVIEGIIACIKKPNITIDELMKYIRGPDFPTAGYMHNEGIDEIYKTGRGALVIRGKNSIEKMKGGRERIVISELPYQSNKTDLIKNIAKLVQEKKIEDISDIRDESAKDQIRIVLMLKRGANSKLIVNRLFKLTGLQTKFYAILLGLVAGQPKILNLKQLIEVYVKHRQRIVRKRTAYDLKIAEDREHILAGLMICLKNLDPVITLVKKSKGTTEAAKSLIEKFKLSQKQAQAILDMKLQKLTVLEQDKLKKEHIEVKKKIQDFKKILGSEQEILHIIKQELQELKRKYGDERKTKIIERLPQVRELDLIKKEQVAVILTSKGYIKRMSLRVYQEQRRGGKGITGTDLTTGDFVQNVFVCSTHDFILFLTERGLLYMLKAYNIPEATRYSKGKALVNLLHITDNIKGIIPLTDVKQGAILIVTKKGIAKRVDLENFVKIKKSGVKAASLPLEDSVIDAKLVNENDEIIIATKKGIAARFSVNEIRRMGKAAYGVTAIKLSKDDEVIGFEVLGKAEQEKEQIEQSILTVTEKGYGKRSAVSDYRKTARACKGIININCSERNGSVKAISLVAPKDSIIVTTAKGMVIRVPCTDIRIMGRNTQGVRIIRLRQQDNVSDLVKVQS